MFKRMVKLSIKAVGIGALSGVVLFFVYGQTSSQTPSTRIVIVNQAGSPVLLLSTGVDSANALEPHYSYTVTNTTDKPISAYAIQQRVSLGPGTPVTSTSFVYFPTEQLLLRPHESKNEDGGFGKTYALSPTEVALSVDFVEFTDGSKWGDDMGKSGDRLDGQRAGGSAAIKKYRDLLARKGVEGVELALTKPPLIEAENEGRSAYWQEGFKTGVNFVTHRLITAKLKDGPAGIKSELNKSHESKYGKQ